ncbi:MAG: cysteine--tRNA ligase [Eubacteriales bacterium]|nr:cysteine--tRNA ligase [Eubacteriales bacterium]
MRIYNSQSRQKEEFIPLVEGQAGVYCCGPTVYDYFHIGNARPFIMFDLLRRVLKRQGLKVTYVQNFTDIDDKMITRATREGVSVKELGDRFIAEYFRDAGALGVEPADEHPRATSFIPQIVELIEELVDKGLAYEADGDVYYSAADFPDYGKLSGQNMEDLEEGARVVVDEDKRSPMDFALWKAAKPGEPSWDSPWGKGRPGWHIECSAMSMSILGESIDIHCGGQDLIFPHHENEIAQSEGATGKPFVRYWMHNGFLNINSEKMSKSRGNFFTVRDILKEYDAEDVRMLMLSAHYRSPLNFSREMMEQARASLTRLYTVRDHLAFLMEKTENKALEPDDEAFIKDVKDTLARFDEALADDLNTAEALGALFELVYAVNTSLTERSARQAIKAAWDTLHEATGILGLITKKREELPEKVRALAEQRAQARKDRDWQKSDALRAQLTDLGYTIEDTPQGQKVRKAL